MTLKQLVKAAVGFTRYIITEDLNKEAEYSRVDIKNVYSKYKDYIVDEFTTHRNVLNIYLVKEGEE